LLESRRFLTAFPGAARPNLADRDYSEHPGPELPRSARELDPGHGLAQRRTEPSPNRAASEAEPRAGTRSVSTSCRVRSPLPRPNRAGRRPSWGRAGARRARLASWWPPKADRQRRRTATSCRPRTLEPTLATTGHRSTADTARRHARGATICEADVRPTAEPADPRRGSSVSLLEPRTGATDRGCVETRFLGRLVQVYRRRSCAA
jgi:hypothetical protein